MPRSIQKTAKIYSETAKIYSVYQTASRNSIWKNHSRKPKKCVYWKDPWRMNDHLNCKIQLVLHIYGLVKQNRIKSSLLNILSFISVLIFCMKYTTVAPWVASALALINSVTLGWLAFCQHSNLVFLNQALVDLWIGLVFDLWFISLNHWGQSGACAGRSADIFSNFWTLYLSQLNLEKRFTSGLQVLSFILETNYLNR